MRDSITPILNYRTNITKEELVKKYGKDGENYEIENYTFKDSFIVKLLGDDVPDTQQLFGIVNNANNNMFWGDDGTIAKHKGKLNITDHPHRVGDYFQFYVVKIIIGDTYRKPKNKMVRTTSGFTTTTFPGCCGILSINNNQPFYSLGTNDKIGVLRFFFDRYAAVQLFDYTNNNGLKEHKKELESIGFTITELSYNPKTERMLCSIQLSADRLELATTELGDVTKIKPLKIVDENIAFYS